MYELAALAAALCWAMTGVMAAGPAAALGPFAFSLYRQIFVAAVLGSVVLVTGGWHGVTGQQVVVLCLSGFLGIFLGDTALFLTLTRLGPRRTGALFALNAPMAALLGWGYLGETLAATAWAGVFLCAAGSGVAVLGRPGRSGGHAFEAVRGPVWIGVGFGLLAALGQACGSLIARPVMAAGGIDAVTATLIRVSISIAALTLLMALPVGGVRPRTRLTRSIALRVMASAFLAMVVGMTLLLYALSGGKVGVISTLSALSPVLILPVLWVLTGIRPSATSWAGAGTAMLGLSLIFLT